MAGQIRDTLPEELLSDADVGLSSEQPATPLQRDADVGVTPSPWYRRWIADPALALARGVVAWPESLVGLADIPTGGAVGKALEAGGYGFQPKIAREFLESQDSPEARAARERVARAQGFFGKLGTAVENPSVIAGTVLESVPSMLGGGAIARGAGALVPRLARSVTAAGIGEGAVTAGQQAEQTREETPTGLLTPKQSALSLTAGAVTGVIGALGGKIATKLGIEDPDLLAAAVARPSNPVIQSRIGRVVLGALQEAGEETLQSAQEQIQQNIAQGKPWDEGVADNAALGALSGAVMSGAANLMSRNRGGQQNENQTRQQNEVEAPSALPPLGGQPPQPGAEGQTETGTTQRARPRGRIRLSTFDQPTQEQTPTTATPPNHAAEIIDILRQGGEIPSDEIEDLGIADDLARAGMTQDIGRKVWTYQKTQPLPPASAEEEPSVNAPKVAPGVPGGVGGQLAPPSTPVAPVETKPPITETKPVAPGTIPAKTVTISTGKPNGAQAEVEYQLIDAADLKPLIVAQVGEAQTRERKGSRPSSEQINQIAANPDFNLLGASPTSIVGAPVVDDVVLAGNARASGIVLGYAGKTKGAERYRAAVLSEAQRLGLDPSGITNPVLVRRVRRYTNGDRASFVVESNPKYAALQETTAEQALLDAKALGDVTSLPFSDSGTLTAAGVIQASQRLNQAQRGVMRTRTGSFDANELNRRVQLAALAQIAQQNNVSFLDLSGLLERDLGKRYVSELIRFAPRMSKLDADLSLTSPWLDALRMIQQGLSAVNEGTYKNLKEWDSYRRSELVMEPLSPEADFLVSQLVASEGKPTQIRIAFSRYLVYAEHEQSQRRAAAESGDIFTNEPRQPITGTQLVQKVQREEVPAAPPSGARVPNQPAEAVEPEAPPPVAPPVAEPAQRHTEKSLVGDFKIVDRRDLSKEGQKAQRELLEKLMTDWTARYKDNPTFFNLFPIYLYSKILTSKGKASTYQGYITHVGQLLQEMPELQTLRLPDVTDDEMIRIWTPMRDDLEMENRGSTFNSRRNVFKETLLETEGMSRIPKELRLGASVMNRIPSLPQGKYSPPGLEAGTRLQELFDKIRTLGKKNSKDAADTAELLAYTGLRVSELMALKWGQVNFDLGTVRVEDPKKQTHGRKPPYDFIMNPALKNTLLRMRSERRNIKPSDFISQFMVASPDEDNRITQLNEEYLKPASEKQGGYTGLVTTKDFRHFWTSLGTKLGVDPIFMAEMHGRRAPKLEGTGAQATYIHYLGEKKVDADKFKFGTAADTTTPPPAPPAAQQQPPDELKEGPAVPAEPQTPAKLTPQQQSRYAHLLNIERNGHRNGSPITPVEQAELNQLRAVGTNELPGMPPPKKPPQQLDLSVPQGWESIEPNPENRPLTREEVQAAVAKEKTYGFQVNIITSAEGRRMIEIESGGTYDLSANVAGMFYDGQIFLFHDNITAEDVGKVIREEAAHGLLRTPEGSNLVAQFLNVTEAEKQAIRDIAPGYAAMSDAQLVHEFIAKAARENQTWWQRAKEAVRVFLSRFGLELTNEEAARVLLKQAERRVGKTWTGEFEDIPEAAFAIGEDEPKPDGADDVINIAGREYPIVGKDRMTPAQKAAAAQRVVALFQRLNLPGEEDTVVGRGPGSTDLNTIWRMDPGMAMAGGYEAEGNQLIEEITNAIRGQNGPGGDPAYVSQLINAVNKNFVQGNLNGVFSEQLIDRLLGVTLSETTLRGQQLRAITGIGDDIESIARNLNFYVRRILSDNFGGAEVRKLMERVMVEFRDWFTEAELNDLSKNPNAAGAREQLEKVVTRIHGLNRREEGGRVYRFIQRLFKPKFAKTLGRMEKDARVVEAVNKIVEDLKKQGMKPKPPVGKKNLTALEALLYMVQPETATKIDAAIANAIREGELNAGKKYALGKITDPDEQAELEGYFEAGQEPTEEDIENGLMNPEFAHWKVMRDNLTGYNPVTIAHAQKIISEEFRGTERDNIYGQKIKRPKDTRIDLNRLAKEPDAEKARVLSDFLFNVSANMDLNEADPETQLRVSQLISEQFQDQLKRAEKRVLDNFLEPPQRIKAVTPQERMSNLLNAKLARDPRFRSAPVVALLQRVAQRFANAEMFDNLATQDKTDKARWIEETGTQIVDSVPELAALDPNDNFRQFAEQVVFNDLATRLQAAESRLVRRILDGKDAKLGTEPVDQERVVERLNADRDRLQGAVNAGLIDSAMVDSLVMKNVVQKLLPTLNQMIRQALNTPFNNQEELFDTFSEHLVNDLRVDPAVADKARELLKRAYAAKFKEARKLALNKALSALTPRELRVLKGRKARWQAIEEAINAGAMDDLPVLEAIAKRNHWMPITPAIQDQFKTLVARMDSLRELNPTELAKVGADPLARERATRDKMASTEGERVRLKKEIETLWARITKPIDLRTREGRENLSTAAMEFSSANLLARAGFPVKQFQDIITQGAIHTPTRALAMAFNRFYDNRRAGLPTHFWQDANVALRDAYKVRLAHWRETLSSAALAMTGTQDARNVERLLSGIAAFERMEQYANELASQGKHAQAFVLRLLTIIRLGYRVAAAFDNVHGTPAEWQEMRQQAMDYLRDTGIPASAASLRIDEIIGNAKAEWLDAMETAKRYFETSGLKPTGTTVRGAAANITKARAYQRLRELGMPADSFEEHARLLRNTIGWNERESGGPGGVVAGTMLRARQLSQSLPLPFSAIGAIFNFGNAIGTSINRVLSFTPLGFNPRLFGVERQAIEGGIDATRGSPWYRTRADRTQRKLEATIGTAIGGLAFTLAATGMFVVRNRWPKDKEERELFERAGHRPGTVEIHVGDGFIPLSMTSGPLVMLRPYLAAGGAIYDLLKDKAKAQAKLDAEAAKNGTIAGKVAPLSFGDMLGVAGEAAQAAIVGGRTASGLIGAFTDYGIPNVKKLAANVVAPYIPGLPALQEVSRMAGVRLDSKMASFGDFLLPLPTSGAVAVNMLGDKVGTENDLQRVVQVLTGGSYPYVANEDAKESAPYRVMFESGYRPPSISSTKGYEINGEVRPLTNEELVNYTKLRGQYLKQELAGLSPGATKAEARQAYQVANQRALADVGVTVDKTPVSTGGTGTGGVSGAGARARTQGGYSVRTSSRIRSTPRGFGRIRLTSGSRSRRKSLGRLRTTRRTQLRRTRRIRQYA